MNERTVSHERQMARLQLLKDLFHVVGVEWERVYQEGEEGDWPTWPTMLGRATAEGRLTEEEVEMARKMAGLPAQNIGDEPKNND